MNQSRAEYLIAGLLRNNLTGQELDELLYGLTSTSMTEEYSELLRQHFDRLTAEQAAVVRQEGGIFRDDTS